MASQKQLVVKQKNMQVCFGRCMSVCVYLLDVPAPVQRRPTGCRDTPAHGSSYARQRVLR
jgi:hypothetical protein